MSNCPLIDPLTDSLVGLTEAERMAHAAFVAKLGEGALWRSYADQVDAAE